MCLDCIIEVNPDRQTFCSDECFYILNYKGCHSCGCADKKIECVERKITESNEEENVCFKHICFHCHHLICEHFYRFYFDSDENTQLYYMKCNLCGHGSSVHQIQNYSDSKTQSSNEEVDKDTEKKETKIECSSLLKEVMLFDKNEENPDIVPLNLSQSLDSIIEKYPKIISNEDNGNDDF